MLHGLCSSIDPGPTGGTSYTDMLHGLCSSIDPGPTGGTSYTDMLHGLCSSIDPGPTGGTSYTDMLHGLCSSIDPGPTGGTSYTDMLHGLCSSIDLLNLTLNCCLAADGGVHTFYRLSNQAEYDTLWQHVALHCHCKLSDYAPYKFLIMTDKPWP